MQPENPYQAAIESPASPRDRVRIWNINLAAGPLLFAVVIGPLLLGAIAWNMLPEWSRLSDQMQGRIILWTVILCAAVLAALVYSVRVPIWWIELGPTLRYAKLLKVYDVGWNEVQRIWWDVHNERGPLFIRFATHRALVVRIDDFNDIQVLVPDSKASQVQAIVSKHRMFRDSPYDIDERDDTGSNDAED